VGELPDRVRELLPDEVVDELLSRALGEEEIVGPGGLLVASAAFTRQTTDQQVTSKK